MNRILIFLGLILVTAGLAWPFIIRSGLGRLPGDFLFRRNGFTLYFPLTTSIIISLILSLIFWLLFRR